MRGKRIISAFLALSALSLPSCGSGAAGDPETTDAPSTDAETTTAGEVTVTGIGTMVWHVDTTFTAVVDVTISGDKIESIALRSSSVVSTDAFTGWRDNRESYLAQYNGISLDSIRNLEVHGSTDVTDHHNVGEINGDIDAIAGATASSVVIAMAVKDAVNKYDS